MSRKESLLLALVVLLGAGGPVYGAETAARKPALLKPGVQVMLTNTPAAPLGARGTVELSATSAGPTGFSLLVETHGLRAGNYRVEAVTEGEVVRHLGSLALHDPTATPDKEAGDSNHEDSTAHQSEALGSRSTLEWPPDLRPEEVVQVRVSAAGGSALLASPGAALRTEAPLKASPPSPASRTGY